MPRFQSMCYPTALGSIVALGVVNVKDDKRSTCVDTNNERNLPWITVEEMRRHLSISKTKAYEIATSGCVETVKIGRCLRINARSLDRWLESQRYPKA